MLWVFTAAEGGARGTSRSGTFAFHSGQARAAFHACNVSSGLEPTPRGLGTRWASSLPNALPPTHRSSLIVTPNLINWNHPSRLHGKTDYVAALDWVFKKRTTGPGGYLFPFMPPGSNDCAIAPYNDYDDDNDAQIHDTL